MQRSTSLGKPNLETGIGESSKPELNQHYFGADGT